VTTNGNTPVLTHAILLLKECYGQMGAEPDMETDSLGELINPASIELFKSLDSFLQEITGLSGEDLKMWILDDTPGYPQQGQNALNHQILKNKEHYY
jgi:hypothetical protein